MKLLYLSLFVKVFLCGSHYLLLFYFATFCYSEYFLRSRRQRSHCKFRFHTHVDWRVVASDIGFLIARKFSEKELKVDIDQKCKC